MCESEKVAPTGNIEYIVFMVIRKKNFKPIVIDRKSSQQIVKEYKQKGNEIVGKMVQVLVRAQRKIDDFAYRKTLEKIQKET